MPSDAFAARLFLIDHATTSLDVQYYIYENDLMGEVFSNHLYKAAQRGVKVRILLDDISTAGKDSALALLAFHPNIQLRLFNPNRLRKSFRNLALLLDVNTLGKRMHNKTLIADGKAAIIGGRNIGNVYFLPRTNTLFIDYDILCTGHIVPEIYGSFDLYWNSRQSVPSEDVLYTDKEKTHLTYEKEKQFIDRSFKQFQQSETGRNLANSSFNTKLKQHNLVLTVAKEAHLYYDHPNKVITDEKNTRYHISSQISDDLKKVKKELIVVSPYFIPSTHMMQKFKLLRQKGVKITVITNSLSSTDVFPVYGGYVSYVKPLIEMGIDLYELKPNSLDNYFKDKAFKTSLHTKMIVIDRQKLIIGSANIDPRSDKLNTEIVMIIHSKKLAKKQYRSLQKIIKSNHLYHLSWGSDPTDEEHLEGPVWETVINGEKKRYYYPPHAPLWKRLGADIISILPVKGYL
jgi:putative cardiolipin synthase